MRDDVLSILRWSARRLMLRRCAEAAAMMLTAGALVAAVLELAWTLAWWWPVAGAAICTIPVAAGTTVAFWRPVRKFLAMDDALTAAMGGFCVAAGAIALAMILGGAGAHVARAAVPLAILPAGALAGAAMVVLRRLTPLEAAVYLDARCGLSERMSTAVELAVAGASGPAAKCVYEQALALAGRDDVAHAHLWRRGAATVGAMGLAIILCAAMNFLPSPASAAEDQALIDQLGGALGKLTERQREELAESLRKAADDQSETEIRLNLDRARQAVEQNDPEAFKKAMEVLAKAGIKVKKMLPKDVLDAASKLGGKGATTSPSPNGGTPTPTAGDTPSPSPAPMTQSGTTTTQAIPSIGPVASGTVDVHVYDPAYHPTATATAIGPAPTGPASPFLPWSDAWDAARAKAAAALAGDRVPPQYRQLVKDYFAKGQGAERSE